MPCGDLVLRDWAPAQARSMRSVLHGSLVETIVRRRVGFRRSARRGWRTWSTHAATKPMRSALLPLVRAAGLFPFSNSSNDGLWELGV